MSRALREEERSAWQSLIRVLGHELNNSLAPIISIAGSLRSPRRGRNECGTERQDFQRGLDIIESRTASLHRFLQSYRALAQMPPPAFNRVALCAHRGTRRRSGNSPSRDDVSRPRCHLMIDPDLIEQMLINLVRNAVDAALEQARATARTLQKLPRNRNLR